MKNILFICTGNTCRSSMAAALLKHYGEQDPKLQINVKSAGTAALNGQRASENAVLALGELNIDLSTHRSRAINLELIEEADLILTMTTSHKQQLLAFKHGIGDKVYTLGEFAAGNDKNISDPFGGSLDIYKECRDEIIEYIKKVIHFLNENQERGAQK